jgi:hypothetical protein
VLGLRPRDQHPRVDLELEVPEALLPAEERHGLALAPPAGQIGESGGLVGLELARSRSRITFRRLRPVAAPRQQLRVEAWRVGPGRRQRDRREDSASRDLVRPMGATRLPGGRPPRRRSDRAVALSSSLRPLSRRTAARRVTSSSSPARSDSRLWTVSLMR